MASSDHCLGICFSEHQLFYAVNDFTRQNHLNHIGCIDFNFNIKDTIVDSDNENFSGLENSLYELQQTYNCSTVRMMSPAVLECWSILPRLVYETPDEREDHLSILMDGMPRNQVESTWFDLSNHDFKLLMVRNRQLTDNYRNLLMQFNQTDFVSEFELGLEWNSHAGINGSYLTVHCLPDHIAISSFLLGKLRGTTYIRYDSVNDLPYLWSYYGRELGWIDGIHEEVYVFGALGLEVLEVMSSFFSETGRVVLMNNLDSMLVKADESTYGFKLESSFPAIILSLNLSKSNQKTFSS